MAYTRVRNNDIEIANKKAKTLGGHQKAVVPKKTRNSQGNL